MDMGGNNFLKDKEMRILVIIPAFNEAGTICDVIHDLTSNYAYDYLIVNDGSTDETEKICIGNQFNFVSLPVNLGIGGCVQTGYLYAKKHDYDIAVQMDGDGQHDPKYIERLIEPIINHEANIVIGSRFITGQGFQSSMARHIGIRFLSGLIHLCSGKSIKDVTSGFRAIDRKFIDLYARNYAQDYPEPEAIMAGFLHRATIQEVPVFMKERQAGTSSINCWKSFFYMVDVSLAIILYRFTNKDMD
jgi:glycosyltransferase involved in cell wall biosynthesis